ncbi:MAG: biopolymer transporter ExbD [Bacteroidales bacterium]|nr:biopolymer transporter ExbD [Bacteroidales bacterium]
MAKFNRKGKGGTPAISTASLPDIVFMLLFFFMVTTVMREVEMKIRIKLPQATEIKKLEKKSLVSYIYVGKPIPSYEAKFGTEPRIQLNDEFSQMSDVVAYISAEREKLDENDIPQMITSIKADSDVKMGIITDLKQELRKAQALKINYSTRKELR